MTGTLDLREVFPFLNSVSHLSTNLFKNLRVVIEYVPNNAHHLLLNSQVPADVTGIANIHIRRRIRISTVVRTIRKSRGR